MDYAKSNRLLCKVSQVIMISSYNGSDLDENVYLSVNFLTNFNVRNTYWGWMRQTFNSLIKLGH